MCEPRPLTIDRAAIIALLKSTVMPFTEKTDPAWEWWMPYLKELAEVETGVWHYTIEQEFLD